MHGIIGRTPFRFALAGAALVAMLTAEPLQALAQQAASSECQQGIGLYKQRIGLIQRIQALPKKSADPFMACTLFSNLGAANAHVLAWAKANKEWCQIEDNQITGLENEARQVAGIRAKACGVAAQYKKLKSQAEAAARSGGGGFNVDMSADPLAPPVKVPPSAL
jgi:hypothetical protein